MEVEGWGMSITLQGIGADYRQSRGLCGNFDGNRSNDFLLDYFHEEKDGITSQETNDFVEKWR